MKRQSHLLFHRGKRERRNKADLIEASVCKKAPSKTYSPAYVYFFPPLCVCDSCFRSTRGKKGGKKQREREREMEKLTWSRPVTFVEMIFKYFGTILRTTFLSEIDESIGDLLQPCHVSSVSLFARFASILTFLTEGNLWDDAKWWWYHGRQIFKVVDKYAEWWKVESIRIRKMDVWCHKCSHLPEEW